MATKQQIRQLNDKLRNQFNNASNIRHYSGARGDETHLTTDAMSDTDREGRIFVGYTDELIRDMARGGFD
jgi:hypothetical protein